MATSFVGRNAELGALHDVRRALAQSRGSLVLIGGEAGIGKSRLLRQFLRTAQIGKVAGSQAVAECVERAQQPFGPIRTFLATLVETMPDVVWPTRILRAFAQLVPGMAAPAITADHRNSALEKSELFAALAEFFKVVSMKRATILAVEDLQWCDHSTLDFLHYLAPRLAGTRLMVIATYRSENVETDRHLVDTIARLARESTVRSLELQPLSSVEIGDVLQNALQGVVLPIQTKRHIEERCEGNPFFAEELLKSALEPRPSDARRLPLSVRASVLQRIAALPPDEQRILSHAAVLGYRFDPDLLAVVMKRDLDSVLPALKHARDLSLVVEELEPRARVRFRHALTHQAIYEDMLALDARRLHRHVLNTLESLGEGASYVEELAYHASQATDGAKTVRYNELAAASALSQRALSESALCLKRALAAACDDRDRARLLESVGKVAQMQGYLADAIEAFEAAVAIRLRQEQYDDAARLAAWIAGERANRGDALNSVIPYVQAFLGEFNDRLGTEARDRVLVFTARLLSSVNDFSGALSFLAKVSNPETLPPRVRQNYLLTEINRHSYEGDVEAWSFAELKLRVVLADLPPDIRAIALYTIAQTGSFLGANQQVEHALDHAKRIEAEWGLPSIGAFGAATRALYFFLRGRLRESRSAIAPALDRQDVGVVLQSLAFVSPLLAILLDDEALAERCLDGALVSDALNHAVSLDAALVLGSRATSLAKRGRLDTARTDLRAALDMLPCATAACGTLLASAARYLMSSELSRVAELAGVNSLREPGGGPRDANASLVAAIISHRSGSSDAIALANRAAAEYRMLGWPLFEAEALELAGRVDEALALYKECGALRDLRRLAGRLATPDAPDRSAIRLSKREREIAELVTLGLTNAAIADRLAVRTKTVERHLASIFAKLAVRSRAQVAAFMARGGTTDQVDAFVDRSGLIDHTANRDPDWRS